MADALEVGRLSRILLSETREELVKADQKANLLLAGLGVAVAALLGAFASARINPLSFPATAQALFWIGCIAMLGALVLLGRAVLPNTGTGEINRMDYFGDVAVSDMSWEQVRDLAAATVVNDRDIRQFTILAHSVCNKYRWIRQGIFSAALSVLLLFSGSLLGVTID
ncbi:Pycsar system effector family protein [Streptomyces albus]|uniref:Pycsar system effector family protein n=1 Tax=Streptomyces albus TaxID=1888 RepID=UPI003700E453